MPRYFFHVRDGRAMPDSEGTVLPSLDHARREAVRSAGGLLTDHAEKFWLGKEWSMDVMDIEGVNLFTLRFTASSRSVAA